MHKNNVNMLARYVVGRWLFRNGRTQRHLTGLLNDNGGDFSLLHPVLIFDMWHRAGLIHRSRTGESAVVINEYCVIACTFVNANGRLYQYI